MTDNEKKLIELAETLSFTELDIVSRWAKNAHTEEAKKRLNKIKSRMYDQEQKANGHY